MYKKKNTFYPFLSRFTTSTMVSVATGLSAGAEAAPSVALA